MHHIKRVNIFNNIFEFQEKNHRKNKAIKKLNLLLSQRKEPFHPIKL
jgi:hypothetical protein